MFQKIAKVNLDNGWGVELGYEVPQVITQDTVMQLTTKIVKEEGEVDVEAVEYKHRNRLQCGNRGNAPQ